MLRGSGTNCLLIDQDSPGVTIRNTTLEYCMYGARLPDDSIVEWSEYSFPGFHDFAEEVFSRNESDRPGAIWTLVKSYHDPILMDGSMVLSSQVSEVASRGCELRYNFLHQGFDGQKIGTFDASSTHHSVFLHNYDNNVEMEDWGGLASADLRVHHNLMLAGAMGPFGHHSPDIDGPQYIYRNVVYGYDDHGWGSWTFIKSDAPGAHGGMHYYHNLLWGRDTRLFWEPDHLVLRNNILVFTHQQDVETDVIDSDYNLLVNDVDKAWVTGPNGSWLGDDPSAVDWVDAEGFDFGINAGSPAEDAGVAIAGFNDDAVGAPDVGPFELGESPGEDWPRPRSTVYDCSVPERWNGAEPDEEDEEACMDDEESDTGQPDTGGDTGDSTPGDSAADTDPGDSTPPADTEDSASSQDSGQGSEERRCGCQAAPWSLASFFLGLIGALALRARSREEKRQVGLDRPST